MGLFDNVVKLGDKVQSVESSLQKASSDPIVMAVKTGLKLLPEGELKRWLSMGPAQFWKSVLEIFTGRKYRFGEYQIGERYIDQIEDNGNPDKARTSKMVPDEVVPYAQQLLTTLFGVRITDQGDLDALNTSIAAYQARPDKQDIPIEAIKRAVWLKQNKYPDSMYNKQKWDLSWFEKYPLVAPIPQAWPVGLFTGELPGGAYARNGIIEGDSVLRQVAGDFNPIVQDPDADVMTAGVDSKTLLIGGAILAALLLFSGKK